MRPVALALLLAVSGCSAVLSQPPPTTAMSSLEDCRSWVAPPVGDLVAGVGAAVAGGMSLFVAGVERAEASNETDPSWDPHTKADAHANLLIAGGLVAIPAAVALFISARHGFRSAKECRAARLEYMKAAPPGATFSDLRRDPLSP